MSKGTLPIISEEAFRSLVPEEKCASFFTHLKQKYPCESDNNVYEKLDETLFSEGASVSAASAGWSIT